MVYLRPSFIDHYVLTHHERWQLFWLNKVISQIKQKIKWQKSEDPSIQRENCYDLSKYARLNG